MTEPLEPVITSRLPGPNPIRVAIVAAVAIVLALSAAITLAAAPSAPAAGAGPAAPTGSAAPNKVVGPSTGAGRGFALPGFFGGLGALGGGFGGPAAGPGLGAATIVSIDGPNLSLKTVDGWTRTIKVTSLTRISRAGQSIGLSALHPGDSIGFRESGASDGTYQIDAITVILPHVAGQVSAISGGTITVRQFDGTTATIRTGSSTTFRILGVAKATIADLKVGMAINAQGTKNGDGSLQALAVVGGQLRAPSTGGGHKLPGTPPRPSASSQPGA